MEVQAVILSKSLIDAGRTPRGAWTKRQIECLGLSWPPKAGWKKRLEGTLIKKSDYDKFVWLAISPKPFERSYLNNSLDKPKRQKRLRKDQREPELLSFTFDEWVEKGYRVLKGMKSRARNLDGKPLFGADQVWLVPVDKRAQYLTPSKPSGLVEEVKERIAEKVEAEEALHSFMDPDFEANEFDLQDEPPW